MEVPDGFTVIEFDLYHALRVSSINFPFLNTLSLRTIVVLDPGAPSRSLADFAETHNIKLVHLVTEVWRSVSSEYAQMMHVHSQALKYTLDVRNYPIMVIGPSLITGIIRRLENWSFASVASDYSALSEVTGINLRLEDMCSLELMEFCGGDVDQIDAAPRFDRQGVPRSLVMVDLPPKEFRAEWVKNYGINYSRSNSS